MTIITGHAWLHYIKLLIFCMLISITMCIIIFCGFLTDSESTTVHFSKNEFCISRMCLKPIKDET